MLRIVRCTTGVETARDVDAHLARTVARLRATQGNADGFVGRRVEGDEVHYALVTAWNGFAAMQMAIGPDIVHAPLLAPVADRLRGVTVEHFERMDLPAIGGGGEAAVLRIYAGCIGHRQAETFYAFTRDTAWSIVGQADGLVAAHVGRRMASDVDDVAFVTAWRSWDELLAAFPDAAQRPLVVPEDARLVSDLVVEHLDILPASSAGG